MKTYQGFTSDQEIALSYARMLDHTMNEIDALVDIMSKKNLLVGLDILLRLRDLQKYLQNLGETDNES